MKDGLQFNACLVHLDLFVELKRPFYHIRNSVGCWFWIQLKFCTMLTKKKIYISAEEISMQLREVYINEFTKFVLFCLLVK